MPGQSPSLDPCDRCQEADWCSARQALSRIHRPWDATEAERGHPYIEICHADSANDILNIRLTCKRFKEKRNAT